MRTAVLAVVLVTACKGDRDKCDQACRNYGTLVYWQKADAEVAAAPPEQREELKKTKLAKFTHYLESGIDTCVQQCTSANNDEQVDCMIAAKSADAVKVCVADD